MYILEKCSLPNSWKKEFAGESDAVEELRKWICSECLTGKETFIGEKGEFVTEESEPFDIEFEGVVYKCRDIWKLLSTACGCEFSFYEKEDNA